MNKKIKNAVKPINKILNDFLSSFDCEARLGSDFEYWGGNNMIYYALVVPQSDSDAFVDFANSLFPDVKADVFLWSFLHELGHNQTEDDFEDEEWAEYTDKVHNLKAGKDDLYYFNLPQEKAATEWAGNYMRTHKKEVATLWSKLAPAIQNFYSVMEVE